MNFVPEILQVGATCVIVFLLGLVTRFLTNWFGKQKQWFGNFLLDKQLKIWDHFDLISCSISGF